MALRAGFSRARAGSGWYFRAILPRRSIRSPPPGEGWRVHSKAAAEARGPGEKEEEWWGETPEIGEGLDERSSRTSSLGPIR